jgi:transposase
MYGAANLELRMATDEALNVLIVQFDQTCHFRCLVIGKTNKILDWPYRDTRLLRERFGHEVVRR